MTNREEIRTRRRTFAIISHPDAGKTTLTSCCCAAGPSIGQALSGGRAERPAHAVSDWMDIGEAAWYFRHLLSAAVQLREQVREYSWIPPGHQDFSEDTYRTLMAADSAVMVIDAAKGVEAQTIKLFKVCTLRHIPIFTFVNKMDREARDRPG